MKICPHCRTTYTDALLIYCLEDGDKLEEDRSDYFLEADTLKFPKHGIDVAAKYIFLDIVGFTNNRTTEAQADIVKQLNKIVSETIKGKSISDDKKIFIPTGDGLCAVLLNVETPVDIHLQIALSILNNINSYNASIQDEKRRFDVRIGIDSNTDVLVVDINKQQNIAGAGISMASRIMNLADGGQILVGQSVYDTLRHREKYVSTFRTFQATVKHNTELYVYQFIGEGYSGLDVNIPSAFRSPKELAALTEKVYSKIVKASVEKPYNEVVKNCPKCSLPIYVKIYDSGPPELVKYCIACYCKIVFDGNIGDIKSFDPNYTPLQVEHLTRNEVGKKTLECPKCHIKALTFYNRTDKHFALCSEDLELLIYEIN